MPDLGIELRGERAHFAVRLIPRASRDAVAGVREGILQVRVTAAPVNGAANRALIQVLGKTLRLGPTAIRIETGAISSRKRLSAPATAVARLRQL